MKNPSQRNLGTVFDSQFPIKPENFAQPSQNFTPGSQNVRTPISMDPCLATPIGKQGHFSDSFSQDLTTPASWQNGQRFPDTSTPANNHLDNSLAYPAHTFDKMDNAVVENNHFIGRSSNRMLSQVYSFIYFSYFNNLAISIWTISSPISTRWTYPFGIVLFRFES